MSRSVGLRVGRVASVVALVSVAVAVAATVAVGRPAATIPAALSTGEHLFQTVGCSACHSFKAARATGKIGPSLDTVKLTKAQLVTQIGKGGCAVMTPAACAKYKFKMSPFKPRLTAVQIADVAAFVYTYRNHAPVGAPPTTTTTKTTTTPTTPVTTGQTTTTAPTTTTTSGANECPAGTTIQSSGNTDGDDDETGRPSDLDGCI